MDMQTGFTVFASNKHRIWMVIVILCTFLYCYSYFYGLALTDVLKSTPNNTQTIRGKTRTHYTGNIASAYPKVNANATKSTNTTSNLIIQRLAETTENNHPLCDANWWIKPQNHRQFLSKSANCTVHSTHSAADPFTCQQIFRQVLTKAHQRLPDIQDTLNALDSSVFRNRSTYSDQWNILTRILESCGYEQRLPDVINIGFKKSGTTMFAAFLSEHPQIARSLDDEMHFFDWQYEKGLAFYKSRMGFATKDTLSFEKTPRYARTPDAPKNIFKDLPNHIKFVLLVKDPVKRSISEFRHEAEIKSKKFRKQLHRSYRKHTPTPNSEGLLFDQATIHQDGSVNISNEIIDTSLYSKHFKNWLTIFPRERFLVIEYNQLIRNATHVLQGVEQFLGLRSFFQENMFKLEDKKLCFVRTSGKKRCPGKEEEQFKIPKGIPSQRTLRKLCNFFEPYNREFELMTDRKFNWKCA